MPLPSGPTLPRALGAIAAASALLAGLAACAQAGEAGDEVVGDATSDRLGAVAEPPVSVAEENPDDPSTWVIANGAVGGIRLGADFDGALAAADGGWVAADACSAVWHGADYDVTFSTDGADIAAIAVTGEIAAPMQAPSTPEGLGLGSTRDEVRAVYPTADETPVGDSGAVVLRPTGTDPTGADLGFEVSKEGRVVEIVLATDRAAGAGGC